MASHQQAQPQPMRLESHHAVVRLLGPVTTESIIILCDQIDECVEYYQYGEVHLEISSPGGEVIALEYFQERLGLWRTTRRLKLRTRGLTQVASAAACMLSLGDVGSREVSRSASLVYHLARHQINGEAVFTAEDYRVHLDALTAADERMLDLLSSQAFNKAVKGELRVDVPQLDLVSRKWEPAITKTCTSKDQVVDIYRDFFRQDTRISAEQAIGLQLVDRQSEDY